MPSFQVSQWRMKSWSYTTPLFFCALRAFMRSAVHTMALPSQSGNTETATTKPLPLGATR